MKEGRKEGRTEHEGTRERREGERKMGVEAKKGSREESEGEDYSGRR